MNHFEKLNKANTKTVLQKNPVGFLSIICLFCRYSLEIIQYNMGRSVTPTSYIIYIFLAWFKTKKINLFKNVV